jgi:hypothetical protein
MSGGIKRIIFNTRERVISSDFNRAFAFLNAGLEDAFRHWLLARTSYDAEANGVATLNSSVGTPLDGVIFNGLMCQPQIGSTDLFITPGVAIVTQPDSPHILDDSYSKLVVDAGVNTPGALTYTPNAGPGERIDIVECRRVDTLLNTSNRDIYNATIGLFAPATVDKERASRMNFRIRLGSPGGGFPGVANGWMPLMVCTSPASSTTWDDAICWDVRPLLSDYVDAPSRSFHDMPSNRRVSLVGGPVAASPTYLVRGLVESSVSHWRAGGMIPLGGLDIENVYSSPGFVASLASSKTWHLYALFPRNLPRWCEYTPYTDGVRKPTGFRGIPVASTVLPGDARGRSSALIVPPAFTGLSSDASDVNVALVSGNISGGALSALHAPDEWQFSNPDNASSILASNVSPQTFDFNLDESLGLFPANAKFLLAEFIYTFDKTVSDGGVLLSVRLSNGVTTPTWTDADSILIRGESAYEKVITSTHRYLMKIPLLPTYPNSLGLGIKKMRAVISFLSGGGTNETMRVKFYGWQT